MAEGMKLNKKASKMYEIASRKNLKIVKMENGIVTYDDGTTERIDKDARRFAK